MPIRGLLKRDDPKLQASVAFKYQVLLGSCLTAHASGASPSMRELPLRMHVMMRTMSLYLDVYYPVSCGASAYAEAYIHWRSRLIKSEIPVILHFNFWFYGQCFVIGRCIWIMSQKHELRNRSEIEHRTSIVSDTSLEI